MPVTLGDRQPGVAAHRGELGRLDELRVVVRAARQQPQHVLGADHREQIRLRIAVDASRKNTWPPGFTSSRTPAPSRRVGHVLEQLHAGDDVVLRAAARARALRRRSCGTRLRAPDSSRCSCATLSGLSARSMPVTCAPRAAIASLSMPPPQPTSSTRLAAQAGDAVDVVEAQRIDVVQRLELARRDPTSGARAG